jgi:ketosteroid isomerase-like protein
MGRMPQVFAALYTADAKLLPPAKTIISGKDDIEKFWEKAFQGGFADHKIDILELRSSGNWAYQASHWIVTGPGNSGGRVTHEGKLVSILEKQPDGTWKARLHTWNNEP